MGLTVLLSGENALADPTPSPDRLMANLHVFSQAADDSGLASPPWRERPERLHIPTDGGPAMEMAIFDPGGPSTAPKPAAETLNKTAAEPPRPGSLGRQGSPLYRYQADFFLHSGYRQDNLDWNIAAPGGSPNILSELQWKDLDIVRLKGDFSLTSPAGWRLQGLLGYGWILEGDNQDSDYLGDNRTLEFSRSNNQADRGYVFDAALGIGYRFGFGGDTRHPLFSVTPLAGYSYHEQSLRAHNFHQTVSDFGFPLSSGTRSDHLDSRYETQWHGPWLGLGLQTSILDRIDLFGEIAHHWASYHAQADWNLREDFMHPRSFVHNADGTGVTALAGARYRSAKGWALEVTADYQRWRADPGKDKVFFSNGVSAGTRLNEVNWTSLGLGIGFGYAF